MLEQGMIERMSRLVPEAYGSRRRRGPSPGSLFRPLAFSTAFRFRPPRADERD